MMRELLLVDLFFLFGICEDAIVGSQNDKTLLVSLGCGPAPARILVNIRIIALLGWGILHDPTILDVFPWKTYVKRGLLKCDGMGKGVSFQEISGIFGVYAKFWASTFFLRQHGSWIMFRIAICSRQLCCQHLGHHCHTPFPLKSTQPTRTYQICLRSFLWSLVPILGCYYGTSKK